MHLKAFLLANVVLSKMQLKGTLSLLPMRILNDAKAIDSLAVSLLRI